MNGADDTDGGQQRYRNSCLAMCDDRPPGKAYELSRSELNVRLSEQPALLQLVVDG